ncbi:carboxymuconolactone decarboxylase family protein [Pararhodobacter zhoushanensis]|uniref:Carboxymuconolactone decarboxylase family protein n=1 Tax=Pararhodobacter zhoushanensis TaxID=2479545 RepID=A0ABT3GXM1_9RHOB|nr:carboxymuconolactone decarboxylase family protein [Pararhodobacter zhoushanensis]MCW1932298.1 carboxymuconolactone decarboxylase family protein [Pararhodobacter zhoushanensis]
MRDGRPQPLSDTDWPEDARDLLAGFAGKLNVYRVMAHHPALLAAWAPLRRHIVLDTSLGRELSEVVILRTGHRFGSAYEWAHHVSRARELGFSDARIAATRGRPEGDDGLIVQAVDALLDDRKLSGALEGALVARFGRKAVFDLIATVGFYSVLGYLLLSYDVPVDDQVAAELLERPLSP